MGLVRVRRVELAEPFLCGVSPLVEVLDCRLGELLRAESLAELEHLVFQGLGQFALGEDAVVGLDEGCVQERRRQGGVIRPQEAPRRVATPHDVERVVVEIHKRVPRCWACGKGARSRSWTLAYPDTTILRLAVL